MWTNSLQNVRFMTRKVESRGYAYNCYEVGVVPWSSHLGIIFEIQREFKKKPGMLYRHNAAIGTDWNLFFWDSSLYLILTWWLEDRIVAIIPARKKKCPLAKELSVAFLKVGCVHLVPNPKQLTFFVWYHIRWSSRILDWSEWKSKKF